MLKRRLPQLASMVVVLTGAAAQAVPVIPADSGWGGHVNLGVGVGTSESNMLGAIGSIDLGSDTISSLGQSPDDEDVTIPQLQFEVAYTLADSRTQFYLGNQVVDYLSFDLDTTLETHLGVRQVVEGIGTLDISLAASTMPTDVWKDPYLVGSQRGDTERTSSGFHIGWDNIFDTALEFEISVKQIEIDDEESGASLALSPDDQRLLRRTGNVNRLFLHYDWQINERHRLVPAIGYLDYDLDGDAMAEDGAGLEMKYLYDPGGRWRFVSSLFYHDLEADTVNPIYGDQREVETQGGSVTAFFSNPFGLKGWTANASASYHDSDNKIDFYDSTFGLVSIGMLYRFD